MNNYLVKVAKFQEAHTANLMKGVLENESIFAKLEGEHASSVLPIFDNFVYLSVFKNDVNSALSILEPFKKKFDFTILINLA